MYLENEDISFNDGNSLISIKIEFYPSEETVEKMLWAALLSGLAIWLDYDISIVSCQKGPTCHAYAWQIGPFWQDTHGISIGCLTRHLLWQRSICPRNWRWGHQWGSCWHGMDWQSYWIADVLHLEHKNNSNARLSTETVVIHYQCLGCNVLRNGMIR